MKANEIKEKMIDWLSDEYSREEAELQIDSATIETKTVHIITYDNGFKDVVFIDESGKVHHVANRTLN